MPPPEPAHLLSIGQPCSSPSCQTITFLPLPCPHCRLPFCSSHIHGPGHGCFDDESGVVHVPREEQGVERERMERCAVEGCVRVTMQAAGRTGGEGPAGLIGKEIRCEGCLKAFCVEHRSQPSHRCAAPTSIEQTHLSKLSRRADAADAIAQVFPGRVAGKEVAKPELVVLGGLRAAEKLGRVIGAESGKGKGKELDSGHGVEGKTVDTPKIAEKSLVPKGKEDKLRMLALMKLKSKAVGLTPASKSIPSEDRWFFSLRVDEKGEKMRGVGVGGDEAVFVNGSSTVGRVLDELAVNKGLTNKPSASDTSQNLFLVLLGKGDEKPQVLEGGAVVGKVIPQGGGVALVRGLRWQ